MKKSMRILLSVLLIFALTVPGALAEAVTINQVLSSGSLPDGMVQVIDDLSAYQPLNPELGELGGSFKFLILQREKPLKEFTALTVYPPFSDSDGFPDDFEGVDIGLENLYLRCDMMSLLRDDLRATSLEDATYLLIAEDLYIWDGSLIVSDFGGGDDDVPEFNNAEEMMEYFATHQKEVASMTYYPKFGAYALVSLYDAKECTWSLMDGEYYPAKRFARNPDATDHWDNMLDLLDLANALEDGGYTADSLKSYLDGLDFVPDGKKSLWVTCIDENEYAVAAKSVTDYFWTMAEEFKTLDPSTDNAENYDLIIAEKNVALLSYYVDYCDYSGFDQSVEQIGESKEYIASIDPDWYDGVLLEIIGWFYE